MERREPTKNETFIHPVRQVYGDYAGTVVPQLIRKRWGTEMIFFNKDYCMKMITINQDQNTSMHVHMGKHETLLCTSGRLGIDYLDANARVTSIVLGPGEAFVVCPGLPHRLIAVGTETILVESSTHDSSQDSIRITMD